MFTKMIRHNTFYFLLAISAFCSKAKAESPLQFSTTNGDDVVEFVLANPADKTATNINEIDTQTLTNSTEKAITETATQSIKTVQIDIEGIPCLLEDKSTTNTPALPQKQPLTEKQQELVASLNTILEKPTNDTASCSNDTRQEINEFLKIDEEKPIENPPEIVKVNNDVSISTNEATLVSQSSDKTEQKSIVSNTTKEVEKMMAELESEPQKKEIPSDDSEDEPYRKWCLGFLSVLTCAGLGSLCFMDLEGKKKKHDDEEFEEEFSYPPHPPKAPQSPIQQKQTIEREPVPSSSAAVQPDESVPTQRSELAEWLWAMKEIDEIKKERLVLRRERNAAKKNGLTDTLDKIAKRRDELTAKRRAACLRANSKKWAEIRKRRHDLTRQMTKARRRKDLQTMDKITAERLAIKEKAKQMNEKIKAFDYQKQRKSFLKPAFLAKRNLRAAA